ncbi:MAG: hypothetical protein QM493_08715 [Sulfurovum sp.]
MSRSSIGFERWNARRGISSWSFQIFQKHNKELTEMYISHILGKQYSYKMLKKENATLEDKSNKHFKNSDYPEVFDNIKQWSDKFNEFDNWVNLNCIMAISANLETYMATVIKLALESDIGILFGASQKIDGIEVIKKSTKYPFELDEKIISCTKGDWSARISSFEKIFGTSPIVLKENISSLENIRKIRNDIGHAFGREIESSRKHNTLTSLDAHRVKKEKVIKYLKLIFAITRAIDKQLMAHHIGEYQTLHFYHNLQISLDNDDNHNKKVGNHAQILKIKLCEFGANRVSKIFCKELVEYYESLEVNKE